MTKAEVAKALEDAIRVKIEDRAVNWFGIKTFSQPDGRVSIYTAWITDIIEIGMADRLDDAKAAMSRRFTCPLCQIDVIKLPKQKIDEYSGQFLMGQQYICDGCLTRMRQGRIGGSAPFFVQ